jgi:glycosyltransferase involved in cell wall biosynthesis
MTRVTIVTDAWRPQVNGVVLTIERTRRELMRLGAEVVLVTPELFRTVPMPTYPEIRLSLPRPRALGRALAAAQPSYVHIATEGPLGFLARRWCRKHGIAFTTSYHTRFPEYVAARAPLRLSWLYALVRRFHNGGQGCMVATESLERELKGRGFLRLMQWSRGIDAEEFHPATRMLDLPRPIFMNVGRVAVEKNIEAFLDLDLPGTKVVVGDGPAREALQRRYPGVVFTGAKFGADLVRHFASADVFVFPSRTDTFGNVLLEALACGVPVAAYPVTGPLDILAGAGGGVGVLDEDLGKAALGALAMSREDCRSHAMRFSWEASARQFLANVRLANGEAPGQASPA